jgi:hypothetical protein
MDKVRNYQNLFDMAVNSFNINTDW